ncbi:MAG: hypothetical protein GY713_13805, partial [Actinomycetia bacterium]|nr:hypothetical protein [Actinomycetes bacterium]
AVGYLSSLARADVSEIDVQVATDRQVYLTGDPVTITVTKCNPTQSPITVTHNCPCCHDTIEVLDPAGATVANCTPGCPPVVVDITWQPGECKTDTFVWHQTSPFCSEGLQVEGGQYLAHHLWEFPSFSSSTFSPTFLIGSVIDIPTMSPLGYLALALLLCVAGIRFLRFTPRPPDP